MPLFYFDVHDGEVLRDKDGTDCADLAAAQREAVRTAGEMLRDKARFWNGETWTMVIRDQTGAVVAELTFSGRSMVAAPASATSR